MIALSEARIDTVRILNSRPFAKNAKGRGHPLSGEDQQFEGKSLGHPSLENTGSEPIQLIFCFLSPRFSQPPDLRTTCTVPPFPPANPLRVWLSTTYASVPTADAWSTKPSPAPATPPTLAARVARNRGVTECAASVRAYGRALLRSGRGSYSNGKTAAPGSSVGCQITSGLPVIRQECRN